jgi:hypothetical protein
MTVTARKVNGCVLNCMFSFSSLLPSTVNTGLNVYHNKNALSHFVIAGGKTFLSFNLNYSFENKSELVSQNC